MCEKLARKNEIMSTHLENIVPQDLDEGTDLKAFVGVTDNDWFVFLSQQLGIDEVNFWHRV
jgi:hypothetical protein